MRKSQENSFLRVILRQMLDAAIESGRIQTKGKTEDQLHAEFGAYIERWRDSNEDLPVTIDHSPDLLQRAREAKANGNIELSTLFYAMWVEHWLNWLVRCLLSKKNMSEMHFGEIVRTVSIRGKLTWLLALLDAKPIPSNHIAAIQRMADARNAFAHYKWKPTAAENRELREIRICAESFESTIRYLKSYRRIILKNEASVLVNKHVMQEYSERA